MDARMEAEEGEPPMGINDLLLEIGELFLDYGHPTYARKYLLRIPEDASEYPARNCSKERSLCSGRP